MPDDSLPRRDFLRFAGLGAAGLAVSGFQARFGAREPGSRPNIILFLVDDMGWQDTSEPFYSERTPFNARYRTPAMERLAAGGVKFTQAYACCVCSPTRVSLMTGMNAARHRVTNWTLHRNQGTDEPHETLAFPEWNVNGMCAVEGVERTTLATPLPELLRRGGLPHHPCAARPTSGPSAPRAPTRGISASTSPSPGTPPGGPGSHLGEHDYSAAWRNGDKVWDVPGLEAYHGSDVGLAEALTREALKALRQAPGRRRSPSSSTCPTTPSTRPSKRTPGSWQRYTRRWASTPSKPCMPSMIEGMDKSLGDILDFLDAEGIAGNTVVFFMSDNGGLSAVGRGGTPHTAQAPLSSGKGSAREGGVREPMIVRWPGVVKPGSVSHAPVIIEDFFPTLLEIAGAGTARTVQTVDGRSFAPLLRGGKPFDSAGRSIWHFPNNWGQTGPGIGAHSAVRQGDWKLIYYHADRRFELFNLAADIGETDNRVDREAARADALAALLAARLREMGAQMPTDKKTGGSVEWPDQARRRKPASSPKE